MLENFYEIVIDKANFSNNDIKKRLSLYICILVDSDINRSFLVTDFILNCEFITKLISLTNKDYIKFKIPNSIALLILRSNYKEDFIIKLILFLYYEKFSPYISK